MRTREIRLKSRPQAHASADNFELAQVDLPEPGEGELLVRNTLMSVDPYMRGRMTDRPSYVPPFELGKALQGNALGEVVESRAEGFAPGDLVGHMLGWREHALGPAKAFEKIPRDPAIPEGAYLGVLGMPGMTAWAGLTQVGEVKPADTVLVSGAAGAVGQIVCQLAKLKGCTVVGSAGSDAKCEHLRSLGVDATINYKTAGDLTRALKQAAPDGIDLYFDNVGGDHLEAAIAAARPFARLVECGMIALYDTATPPPGPRNLPLIVGKRLRLQGFIVFDFAPKRADFLAEVAPLVREGRLQWEETVAQGLEAAPQAFLGLFQGENTGKMLVRL